MKQSSHSLIPLIVCFVAACALIFYVYYKNPFLYMVGQEEISQEDFSETEDEINTYDETLVIQEASDRTGLTCHADPLLLDGRSHPGRLQESCFVPEARTQRL